MNEKEIEYQKFIDDYKIIINEIIKLKYFIKNNNNNFMSEIEKQQKIIISNENKLNKLKNTINENAYKKEN